MSGDLGRWLMIIGVLIFFVGLIMALAGRIPWLGHLPGDIAVERGNFRFYAPIGTMLLLSLLLTLLLNLVARFFR